MKCFNKKKYLKFFIFFFIFVLYMFYFNLLYKLLGRTGGVSYIGIYNSIIIFFVFFEIGVPKSVSRIISKYDIIGHNKTKETIFKTLSICYMSIAIFLILIIMFFSVSISNLIIKSDAISQGIKLLSLSLFFVSCFGVYTGYFEGISKKIYSIIGLIIQLLIKFISLIILYFIGLKVKMSLDKIIIILCVINILTYIISTIFLFLVRKKTVKLKYKNEQRILIKPLLKQNIKYSIINSLVYIGIVFCFVYDILTLNSILVDKINYKLSSYEIIISTMNIWGIVLVVPFVLLILKLIGNIEAVISKNLIQKDLKSIGTYITTLYKKVLYFSIPISMLVCFCSSLIWNIMYSNSKYGILVFQYLGILVFAISIYILSLKLLTLLKEYKCMIMNFIFGIVIKCLFNVSIIYGINKLGFPGFYGAITTTFLSLFVSSFITIIYLRWKYCINIEAIVKELFNIIIASLIMLITLIILSKFFMIQTSNNILLILIVIIYFIIAILIYWFVTYKFKTIKDIF